MSYPKKPCAASRRNTVRKAIILAPPLVGILTLLLGILPASSVCALTYVNGEIETNTVWSDDVYRVTGDIHLLPDVMLRVLPGTVVKFETSAQMRVAGTLLVEGTASSRVSFTSLSDDNIAGDTGNDGPSFGTPGLWAGVHFLPGSEASTLNFCDIWFAGGGGNGAIRCVAVSPTFSDCRVRAGVIGLSCEGTASPVVERTSIDGCTNVPIAVDLMANPSLDGVVFGAEQDNRYDAVGLYGGLVESEATVRQRQVAIGGSDPVDLSYLLLSKIVVDSTSVLTFESGVVVKFSSSTGIEVHGHLETQSTAGQRVVFTSVHDDQHGFPRDTGRDGNITAPAPGDWNGISAFNQGTIDLQDTDIWYTSAGAVQMFGNGSHAEMSGCKLAYGQSSLVVYAPNSANLVDCDLEGNVGAAVRYGLGADVTWTDLRTVGNGISAIELLSGSVRTDQTLAPRDIGPWSNVTYLVASSVLHVVPGVTLTIEPGVTLKFGTPEAGLKVEGRLVAVAPEENPIIFTSLYDDCTGQPQDTLNDGWAMAPCPGDWGSLDFFGGDPGSVLEGCIIRFGGGTCRGALEFAGTEIDISYSLFEYNLAAVGSFDHGLALTRNKGSQGLTSVAFRNNVLDSIVRLGGTLTADATLVEPPGLTTLFLLASDLTIPFDVHLDISPGVNIVAIGAGINVYGSLSWSGHENQVSRITGPSGGAVPQPCFDCDLPLGPGIPEIPECRQRFGCDLEDIDPLDCTRGKGNAIVVNEWNGIRFYGSSDDERSILRDLEIMGTDEPVWFEDSSPQFERVIFEGMGEDGIGVLGRSAPLFTNCIFRNGAGVPMRSSLSAAPRFVDSRFAGNALHGLGLVSQGSAAEMVLDAKLLAGTGLNSYIAMGDLHVSPGQTLTITPGTILKFVEEATLKVDGQLRVEGINEWGQLVALTSISDDYWGGDTNGDASATRGHDTTWGGIDCSLMTASATPVLKGCVIANVSGNSQGGALRTVGDGAVDLDEVLMVGNDRHVVFQTRGGNPELGTIRRSDFVGPRTLSAIWNPTGAFTVSAVNCWWGAASGPYDGSDDSGSGGLHNPDGEGCGVSDQVSYEPFATEGSHVRLLGDASRDGQVGVYDASLIVRYLADLWSLGIEAQARADVNCDGEVDAQDAAILLDLAAGNIAWLECQPEAPPVASAAQLVYDSFDAQTQTLNLRWSGGEMPSAATLKLAPLQGGVRVADVGLFSESGEYSISAFGGRENTFVAAAGGQFSPTDLVQVKLNLGAGADLSRPLLRIENLRVDGNETSDREIQIEADPNAPARPVRSLSAVPNPFNPATTIDFVVVGVGGQSVPVEVGIYDLSGRLVRTLVDQSFAPGAHQRVWSGRNDDGQQAASGVYFLRMIQGGFVMNQKLTLLK